MTKPKGPRFVQYFAPMLRALAKLGNSGKPQEVADEIAAELKLTDAELGETTPSGDNRFLKNVYFARFYLAKAGLLQNSPGGVWVLSESGSAASLSHAQSLELFKTIHRQWSSKPGASDKEISHVDVTSPDEVTQLVRHRDEVAEILMRLPPAGFEKLSQRLLREMGFNEVEVVGRSGDGGIDGWGVLNVNAVVSHKVLFQCKRWKQSVGPSEIRDFQGAVAGRGDRGLFVTTSGFTKQARQEAARDGAMRIELVDLDRLIDLMEQLEIGVRSIKAFEVDTAFFKQFGYEPG